MLFDDEDANIARLCSIDLRPAANRTFVEVANCLLPHVRCVVVLLATATKVDIDIN